MNKSVIVFLFLLGLLSCQKKTQPVNAGITSPAIAQSDSVFFAKGFQIETHDGYTLATVRNPWNDRLVLQRYVLVPKSDTLPKILPEGILIRTPLARTVCYGSVQCVFLAELDALQTLVGVCEPQYINIPYVRENVQNGKIVDLGQAANPDLEKIILIEPEALFTAPIENSGYGQTAKLGIPFIECVDYMESTPLGRAEWIRFLALFFEKKAIADSLFKETVSRYNELVRLSANGDKQPSVFTETVYSGIWYQPGGNSYIAQFFRDAGADYLWKEDTNTGSIGLTFESVLEKAEKADFWLIKYNDFYDMTYRKLVQENSNYALFDTYKKRNIYICNTGKVPYYEELPIHPDEILKDMVRIFHPELLPDYQLRYYKKME
ncbi:MAG: ABC transporter substrate-binding protein [Candidatus Azobacteroides sp.]|nr:ABC transporter substrate-binding protein [Candidatus Azobacteroides sp.]